MFSSAGAQSISLKLFRGLGHFPNRIARVYKHEHCLPEWQAPVWVLTGFACYSARKSRSYHAGFRKCTCTCCACYSNYNFAWNESKRRGLDEVNPKENDNEIIELTDEELDEIFADDEFDNGEEDGEIRSFYFSNPDPYAKVKPRPDDAPKREFSFDEKGNIVVKNPSAFWLPDVKIVEEHGGTEYTVTGSYEGTETLDRKLRRIMEQNVADDKNGITEDADE